MVSFQTLLRRNHNYRYTWIGQVVSEIGDHFNNIAVFGLVLAQTPQVFRYDLLVRAFRSARDDGFVGTDEASLVERLDVDVNVGLGNDRNIKITKPGDMDLARLLFHEQAAGEVRS